MKVFLNKYLQIHIPIDSKILKGSKFETFIINLKLF